MASKSVIVLGIVFVFTYAVGAISNNSNEQETQLSNVFVVKGTVFCDTRLENPFSDSAYFLPGALVSVDCSIISNRKWKTSNGRVSIEGETDENGEFRVEIPIMHNINPRRSCSVRLLNSPHDSCDIPSIPASSQLTLSSSNSNGIQTYVFTPLSFRPSTEQEERTIISSLPRRRTSEDSTSKATSSSPPLPSIPQLPKFSFPPLPSISPLPKLSVPSLPSVPPLSNVPTVPKLSVPPLPSIPTLPNLNVPPLPSAPTLPNLNIPPLPNLPPLNIPNAPPLPKLSFPPLPFAFPFPPFPFFTPPPPSTNNQSP